jgi:DNA-binding response OmpR family regulator
MRVLIVEDDYLIATSTADVLQRAGCEVAGVAGSVQKALQTIADPGCDAALLDADLRGASSEPVAAALRQRGIPFLVVSGYTNDQRTGALAEAPFLAKPWKESALVAAVKALRA